MVKDAVLGASPATFNKDISVSMDYEGRDEEPRERPLTRSIARAASFRVTTPSPAPSLQNQTVPEDQPLHF